MITEFHYKTKGRGSKRGKLGKRIKVVGNKNDTYECKVCHKILPASSFLSKGTKNSAGIFYLRRECRYCQHADWKERRKLYSISPPKPGCCGCCHKKIKTLELDHQHKPVLFRGWLCKECNTGMGALGDNLRGILQAAIYLENDINKIIEILHKVYGEMFARTNEKKF